MALIDFHSGETFSPFAAFLPPRDGANPAPRGANRDAGAATPTPEPDWVPDWDAPVVFTMAIGEDGAATTDPSQWPDHTTIAVGENDAQTKPAPGDIVFTMAIGEEGPVVSAADDTDGMIFTKAIGEDGAEPGRPHPDEVVTTLWAAEDDAVPVDAEPIALPPVIRLCGTIPTTDNTLPIGPDGVSAEDLAGENLTDGAAPAGRHPLIRTGGTITTTEPTLSIGPDGLSVTNRAGLLAFFG